MNVRHVQGVAIVAPSGWLMGDEKSDELVATVRGLLEGGNRSLVLDLGDVNHMNSIAIGQVVGLHSSYASRGGVMKLCNLTSRIQNMLVITKLGMVFEVHESERAALASFQAETPAS
jgi:anti-sigma B factor antagonist